MAVIIMACCFSAYPEKVLVYDAEKGVILIDTDAEKPGKEPAAAHSSSGAVQSIPSLPPPAPKDRMDIHVDRKKDPSGLYFQSGLEYFKNRDWENAMKNFRYADSMDPRPQYALWIARTYRMRHDPDRMMVILEDILDGHPESDVADDALFEMALYHQSGGNYATAEKLYRRLIEQYPFGVSCSGGERFDGIARKQVGLMRSELVTILKILGFRGEKFSVMCRAFQEKNNMPTTGVGDRATVTALKEAYNRFLAGEQRTEIRAATMARLKKMESGLIVVFLVMLLIAVIFRRMVKDKLERIEALSRSLAEL